MNINRIINIFSLVCGIIILILGVLVAFGVTKAQPEKAGLLFILGGIIIIFCIVQKVLRR